MTVTQCPQANLHRRRRRAQFVSTILFVAFVSMQWSVTSPCYTGDHPPSLACVHNSAHLRPKNRKTIRVRIQNEDSKRKKSCVATTSIARKKGSGVRQGEGGERTVDPYNTKMIDTCCPPRLMPNTRRAPHKTCQKRAEKVSRHACCCAGKLFSLSLLPSLLNTVVATEEHKCFVFPFLIRS